MSYNYIEQKKELFTDEGQRLFIKLRDHALALVQKSGAVRSQEIMSIGSGDSWTLLACIDRMVEIGDLIEVTKSDIVRGQNRIFIRR